MQVIEWRCEHAHLFVRVLIDLMKDAKASAHLFCPDQVLTHPTIYSKWKLLHPQTLNHHDVVNGARRDIGRRHNFDDRVFLEAHVTRNGVVFS